MATAAAAESLMEAWSFSMWHRQLIEAYVEGPDANVIRTIPVRDIEDLADDVALDNFHQRGSTAGRSHPVACHVAVTPRRAISLRYDAGEFYPTGTTSVVRVSGSEGELAGSVERNVENGEPIGRSPAAAIARVRAASPTTAAELTQVDTTSKVQAREEEEVILEPIQQDVVGKRSSDQSDRLHVSGRRRRVRLLRQQQRKASDFLSLASPQHRCLDARVGPEAGRLSSVETREVCVVGKDTSCLDFLRRESRTSARPRMAARCD